VRHNAACRREQTNASSASARLTPCPPSAWPTDATFRCGRSVCGPTHACVFLVVGATALLTGSTGLAEVLAARLLVRVVILARIIREQSAPMRRLVRLGECLVTGPSAASVEGAPSIVDSAFIDVPASIRTTRFKYAAYVGER
jgi:hypothetical protein